MTHPHRHEIRLRPSPGPQGDWLIERQHDGEKGWTPIDLAPTTPLSAELDDRLPSFQALIDEFGDTEKIENLQSTLQLRQQRLIGSALRKALFGAANVEAHRGWIHIVPCRATSALPPSQEEDFLDFVLRLPWMLMTASDRPDAGFLALDRICPFAITLQGGFDLKPAPDHEIRMPPWPRLLLVVPIVDRDEKNPTQGSAHFEELEKGLLAAYNDAGQRAAWQHVKTASELEKVLGEGGTFSPHIVYFYGHADSSGDSTIVHLDPGAHGNGVLGIDELATMLQAHAPFRGLTPVVWINGCRSGIARRASAVHSLSPLAATVIATRTLAAVSDARRLGEAALKLMIDGHAPPIALRDAVKRQTAETVRSARWATPIVAVQYERWTALGSRDAADLGTVSLGDVPRRLDRHNVLNAITDRLGDSIKTHADRCDIVLWRGPPDQGIDVFGKRFLDLIVEKFEAWRPVIRKVDLADVVLERAGTPEFTVGIWNALVTRENRVTAGHGRISTTEFRRAFDDITGTARTMLVLDHGHFEEIRLPLVKRYLEFWSGFYKLLRLDPANCRIVIGIGLNGDAALGLPDEREWLLEPVGARDFAEHVEAYNLAAYDYVAPKNAINRIVTRAGSRFSALYRELEDRLGGRGDPEDDI